MNQMHGCLRPGATPAMDRRQWLAGALMAGWGAGDLDFSSYIPARVPLSAAFRDPEHHLWDPAMVRTPDGACHLLYSRWPRKLGFDAWATHAEIAWATSDRPEGPYRFRKTVLPARGAAHWDGHSVYNTCLLANGG